MAHLHVLLAYLLIAGAKSVWTDEFDHNVFMDGNENFRVYWSTLNETHMEFGLEVNTNGWIAIGLSESGQMANSDIMFGFIDDDTQNIFIQNRYTVPSERNAFLSDYQDLELISGEQIDGVTMIRYIRPIYPCHDSIYSKPVIDGTTQLIYAYRTTDPADMDYPGFHNGGFGNKAVNLLNGETKYVEMPANIQSFNITMDNFEIPSVDTTYHCKLLELPHYNKTQHILRYDAVITPGNEGFVHHMLFYHCPNDLVNKSLIGLEMNCNEWRNMPDSTSGCRSSLYASWAVGGTPFYFPEHVGLEYSGNGSDALDYVLLEVHYDNPQEIAGAVDSSGLTIYYTDTLREYNAEVATTGTTGFPSIWIPSRMDHAMTTAYCDLDFSDIIPADGIKVFASRLHAHTVATSLRLRQIRDGIELPPIDTNKAYDFNYQQYIAIDERVILPGDKLLMECVWNTSHRDSMTFYGQSTSEEMCHCWLFFYPRIGFKGCHSFPTPDHADQFFNYSTRRGWWNETNRYYDASSKEAEQYYHDFTCHNEMNKTYSVSASNGRNRGTFRPDYDFIEYEAPNYCEGIDEDIDYNADDPFYCTNLDLSKSDESNAFIDWIKGLKVWQAILLIIGVIMCGLCVVYFVMKCRTSSNDKTVSNKDKKYEQLNETETNQENEMYGSIDAKPDAQN